MMWQAMKGVMTQTSVEDYMSAPCIAECGFQPPLVSIPTNNYASPASIHLDAY